MFRNRLTPTLLARIVAAAGAVTVLSAVLPAFHDRARVIAEIVPPVFRAWGRGSTSRRPL